LIPVAVVSLICPNLDNPIACTWQLDRLMRDRRRGLESDLGVRNAWRVGPTEDCQLQWVLVEEVPFYLSLDAVKGVKKRKPGSSAVVGVRPAGLPVAGVAVTAAPRPRGAVKMSGKALDDLDDVVAAEAVVAGEFDEIPCPGEHGAALGGARDGDAASAPELQQSFLPEDVQCPQDGVLVHAQHGGEVFGQGQPFAGACLAFGDGPADPFGNLIMKRCRA
jgi:hypothetical protein